MINVPFSVVFRFKMNRIFNVVIKNFLALLRTSKDIFLCKARLRHIKTKPFRKLSNLEGAQLNLRLRQTLN